MRKTTLLVVAFFVLALVGAIVAPAPAAAVEISIPVSILAGNYQDYGFEGTTFGAGMGLEVLTPRSLFTISGDYSPSTKSGIDEMYSTSFTAKMHFRPMNHLFLGGGAKWSRAVATRPDTWTRSAVYPTADIAVGDPQKFLGYAYWKFPGSDSQNSEQGFGVGLRILGRVRNLGLRGSGRLLVDFRVDRNSFTESWAPGKKFSATGKTLLVGYVF